MRRLTTTACTTLLHLCILFYSTMAGAAGTLVDTSANKKCLQYQAKVAHYERLRKQGGSGAQMEKWRKSRQQYKDRWQAANCRRGGNNNGNSLNGKTLQQ